MLTVTDIFAGAGGSSTGMIQVPDVEVVMAANHWQLAVDTHNANHPTTEHACVDLHLEDPRNFPRTDILWASPECTKWSIANNKAKELSVAMGGDPTLFDEVPDELISGDEDEATRSRLLMFDVLRFIEHHRYRAVIVENVVDIAMQSKYRQAWDSWQRGLRKLNYNYRVVSLNSMHAQFGGLPAPQSRDRLYIIAWPAHEKAPNIDRVLRPKAWCPRCECVVEAQQSWKNGRTVGRYRAQYLYVHGDGCGQVVEPAWLPAAAAIDWSIPGKCIGDREKPLADKTRARIAAGIARYWRPFTLEAAGHTFERRPGVRTWPADEPFTTLHGTASKALAVPLEGRDGKEARPVSLPARTQTGRHETALVIPFIAELRGGSSDARPVTDPLCTVTASGNHHALITAVGTYMGDQSIDPNTQPLRTQTSGDYNALVTPYYSASEHAKPVSEPIGTLTTVDRYALLMRNNTGGAEMTTPAHEPMRTLTTAGHQSLITSGDRAAAEAMVDDCLFRMIEPHEVAAGMAFPSNYVWIGNRRLRVRMCGNAVTPPAARDLMWAVAESLGAVA